MAVTWEAGEGAGREGLLVAEEILAVVGAGPAALDTGGAVPLRTRRAQDAQPVTVGAETVRLALKYVGARGWRSVVEG